MKEMYDQPNNLKNWRAERGLTLEQLAECVQTTAANLSRIELGQQPRKELFDRICAFFEKTRSQFFEQRDDANGQSVVASDGIRIVDQRDASRRVPLIDPATAALWNPATYRELLSQSTQRKFATTTSEVSMAAFALSISGAAMEPVFTAGDTVVIDPMKQPYPGDYVAASVNGGPAQIAKYRLISASADSKAVFELVPINTFFPVLRSDNQSIVILGRCQQRIQNL